MRSNRFLKHSTRLAPRAARGFSLVEMLAVLVLIGIVASIVVVNVLPKLEGGKVKAASSGVQTISMAVENYYLDNGNLPERIEDLSKRPGNASNWNGPYARESQLMDPWNKPYQYRRPGEDGRQFDVYSFGSDGQQGGNDNAADIGSWQ